MTKATVNFLLDFLLLIAFATLLACSAIVHTVFPRGTAAVGWSLWGLGYDAWCNIRIACLAVFTLGVLIHVLLHWTWVCNFLVMRWERWRNTKAQRKPALNTIYGVTLLICVLTLLGVLVAAADFAILAPPAP